MSEKSRGSAAARTHSGWLIAGAGLFAMAASLEALIASTHGVTVASIHEHTAVPGVVHALAIVSIPVSMLPVFRRTGLISMRIRVLAGVLIGGLLLIGQTLIGGFTALVVSAAVLVWRQQQDGQRRRFE